MKQTCVSPLKQSAFLRHDKRSLRHTDGVGLGALHLKDEGCRLGLGSFKALGGAFALMTLVKEEAEHRLHRPVTVQELMSDEIRAIGCARRGPAGAVRTP